MLQKAQQHKLELIPHFKTHQSAQVGEWFRELGVTAITVSSLAMAEYFALAGWNDITVAFPVNVRAVQQLNSLAQKIRLTVFVTSPEAVDTLGSQLTSALDFYIEIDAGYGRSGVNYQDLGVLVEILKRAKAYSTLNFMGFYTHPGETYDASGQVQVKSLFETARQRMVALKETFVGSYPDLKLSVGDTPGSSLATKFDGLHSLRPGNFVYYDLVQYNLGSCQADDIAICLAAPVVEIQAKKERMVVHAGWIQLGKDSLIDGHGRQYYGQAVPIAQSAGGQLSWGSPLAGAKVVKVSQEHGIIELPPNNLNKFRVGDLVGILPVHACATAFMMGEAYTLEGERIDMMP
jgi:D-serine deaminase-like pyridoxal phosphate-dependent protein